MPYTPKGRLETAEKMVTVAEDLVCGQRKIIDGLKSINRPTASAEKLLRDFETGLQRALEQRTIASALVDKGEADK